MDHKKIISALNKTWQSIGHDVLKAIESDSIPREDVIELVLDQNNIEMYGCLNKDELKEFNELKFEDKYEIVSIAFKYEIYGY